MTDVTGSGRVPQRKSVSLESAARKFSGTIKEGTYLQRAGVNLFAWVLSFTAAVTVALFAYVLVETPSLPNSPASGSAPDSTYVRLILEQRAQVFNNFTEGVSRLLLNLCLPLLTAILGYLFGQRRAESE